jgi:hypothetical protein
MKRYAILIDGGQADETRPLKGTAIDVRNVWNYLVSPIPDGGRLLTEGVERIDEYRAVFDEAVQRTSAPRAVLYGCRRGQDAVDLSRSGGVFTTCLLNEAKNWAATRHGTGPRILTSSETLGLARSRVDMLGFEQTPTLDPLSGFGTQRLTAHPGRSGLRGTRSSPGVSLPEKPSSLPPEAGGTRP